MTKRHRATQNKESREERKVKTIEELKSINRQLKKQLSQAQREINKLQANLSNYDLPQESPLLESEEAPSGPVCKECKSISIGKVQVPGSGKHILVCKQCHSRWRE